MLLYSRKLHLNSQIYGLCVILLKCFFSMTIFCMTYTRNKCSSILISEYIDSNCTPIISFIEGDISHLAE